MTAQATHPQPISDSIRKIIERAPGSGWCEKHQCSLQDVPITIGTTMLNTHDHCPRCLDEGLAAQREADRKEKLIRMKEGWTRAGIPDRYLGQRLSAFHATIEAQQSVLRVAQRFLGADLDGLSEKEIEALPCYDSLLLLGNVGTGKTLLACAILTDWMHDTDGTFLDSGKYCTASQLLRRIKMSWRKDAQETEQEVFTKLTKPSLLVIDEIGVQFNSDTERVLLTELINDRYNARLRTILVSNLTLPEFTAVVGERIVDRFRDGGKVLVFDWKSQRGRSSA